MTANLTIGDRIRFWLIRLIAGRRTVALNLKIINGGIEVKKEDPAAMIHSCTIVGAATAIKVSI